ncbi:uncharacterized protein ISCGN_010788 [Ixodes scapularis]
MPNKCCVPRCTSNYKTGKKEQVFSFPKDDDTLKKWIRAIPRKDFVPTSYTKVLSRLRTFSTFVQVCAVHFDPSCIERTTSYTDPRTGKVLEAALPVPRLRPGSVPKIFPACPSYLSKPVTNTRDAPDTKKSRQEASQLARALEESAASFEVEQERHRFSTLEELKACLQVASVSVKWTVIHQEKCTMFLNIVDECEPWLKASLTVFENLQVSACYQGAPVKRFASSVVPDSVRDIDSQQTLTANDLLKKIRRYAVGFQQHGLKPGSRVCTQLRNTIDNIAAGLAVVFAGGTLVMAKTSYVARELIYTIRDSECDYILTDKDTAPNLLKMTMPSTIKELFCVGSVPGFIDVLEFQDYSEASLKPHVPADTAEEVVVMLYTSGTTGLPKAVQISHKAYVSSYRVFMASGHFAEDDIILAWNPFTHASGFVVDTICVCLGVTVIITEHSLSCKDFLETLSTHQVRQPRSSTFVTAEKGKKR